MRARADDHRDNMDQQFIFLQEKNGLRKFPIIIRHVRGHGDRPQRLPEETTARPVDSTTCSDPSWRRWVSG
jgi:hypothetical protein